MNRLLAVGFDAQGKRDSRNRRVVAYYKIQTQHGVEYAGSGRAAQLLTTVPRHPIPSWDAAAKLGIYPISQS